MHEIIEVMCKKKLSVSKYCSFMHEVVLCIICFILLKEDDDSSAVQIKAQSSSQIRHQVHKAWK